MESPVLEARSHAQHDVRQEVQEFLRSCSPQNDNAPTAVVIVYRNADGSLGYAAPAGDGINQVGMLEAAKHVLLTKMVTPR